MTKVKICGLRRVEDALVAARAGADVLGFVFAESKRRVTPEVAAGIIASIRQVMNEPPLFAGVFVNENPTTINEKAATAGIDFVQLSGDEDWSVCQSIRKPVIKVVRVTDLAECDRQGDSAIQALAGLPGSLVLIDSHAPGSYGGTGQTCDWNLAGALASKIPLILAGGLHSGNVAEAVRLVKPWCVDVSSGVETDGTKDPAKIRDFVRAVRSVGQ